LLEGKPSSTYEHLADRERIPRLSIRAIRTTPTI
jgi:hypothetical protein